MQISLEGTQWAGSVKFQKLRRGKTAIGVVKVVKWLPSEETVRSPLAVAVPSGGGTSPSYRGHQSVSSGDGCEPLRCLQRVKTHASDNDLPRLGSVWITKATHWLNNWHRCDASLCVKKGLVPVFFKADTHARAHTHSLKIDRPFLERRSNVSVKLIAPRRESRCSLIEAPLPDPQPPVSVTTIRLFFCQGFPFLLLTLFICNHFLPLLPSSCCTAIDLLCLHSGTIFHFTSKPGSCCSRPGRCLQIVRN